jgi:hypothetical protein
MPAAETSAADRSPSLATGDLYCRICKVLSFRENNQHIDVAAFVDGESAGLALLDASGIRREETLPSAIWKQSTRFL